ncbi:MAG: DUF4238 domain-containing protein [Nanoarchaeota archaeon]
MSQNQHYIPQFYLKYFSKDGINISGYNLTRKQIFEGPLKTQCSKPEFYSENPTVEKAFSLFEGKISSVFRLIMEEESFPISMQDYVELVCYIGWQYGRTKKSADEMVARANDIFDYMKPAFASGQKAKEQGLSLEDFEKVKLSHKHPAIETSLHSMQGGLLFHDLQIGLLINTSKQEFITSDSPVVLFNPYFSGKIIGSQLGFASKGLQVYFPISPRHMLLLYDPKYYSIPLTKNLSITLSKKKDIRRINGLQILHADSNIYYHEYDQKQLEIQHGELSGKRETGMIIRPVAVKKTPEGASELIQFSSKHPQYDLTKLSFLSIRDDADPIPGVRNIEAVELHRKFTKETFRRKK